MSDTCVAQLLRAVDRQSRDFGLNPSAVKSVFFYRKISNSLKSHLQYYKIDLSFSTKLQEINSNVCEEYKTEREA